ncbi:succinate dehydrogenase/fumarate reductase iron-sulfur subunit [Paraburkholderia ginsengisoli]|uniref:Succinate dehydrogenase iron-sulfur subunit n=1 Tax=Paraburkholderia ginsengisoli TaxID=311231 RepID=A0A7T4N929_9BURK|nr:succinate dehydrogenase/fumarate reductase iron-sulfur subunit [Paraburkholderia ginsengisoli]QQC67486.1 succinate dehydrogenase/fumarate reductase iron-sulfur subunit [Paraburkholderia ginsengisoli]
MQPSVSDMLSVRVWRGAEDGAFEPFEVPRRASQTVLDVVTHIQRSIDATLSYRFACRVGMCGSCAMTVNGRARWTCRTHVAQVLRRPGEVLEIAPLNHLPIVKDLAVDMTQFFDKWRDAKGFFAGNRDRGAPLEQIDPASPERRAADAGIECIGCGVCYASCDVVGWKPDYLGPAALNRAWTLVNDVRDVQQRARQDAVATDAGCHSCHTLGSCTERCPKALAPTASIAGLKRAARAQPKGGTR